MFRTEVLGDGDAVEVFADLAVVDGSYVEQKNEADKDEDTGLQQAMVANGITSLPIKLANSYGEHMIEKINSIAKSLPSSS